MHVKDDFATAGGSHRCRFSHTYTRKLFNANTCHAYLHTLRWKDRPLQCPRCQSQDIDPWGNVPLPARVHKCYECNGCKRTFNDLTNTLMHQNQRSLPHRLLATLLLCLACSSLAHRQGSGRPWPDELSLVLVAAQCCPCLMRCIANSKARWKPMTSTTSRAIRGKRRHCGKKVVVGVAGCVGAV